MELFTESAFPEIPSHLCSHDKTTLHPMSPLIVVGDRFLFCFSAERKLHGSTVEHASRQSPSVGSMPLLFKDPDSAGDSQGQNATHLLQTSDNAHCLPPKGNELQREQFDTTLYAPSKCFKDDNATNVIL